MTPALRKTIEELIELDDALRKDEAGKYPNGITLGDADGDALVREILSSEISPVIALADTLSQDDLAYVMALAWFGRGNGVAEAGATFQSVLEYAYDQQDEGSVGYLCGMPLSKYLPLGLKRLGVA